MEKLNQKKISAIVHHEDILETIVYELMEEAVARHEISIQGSPHHLAHQFGSAYLNPAILQHSSSSPKKEPFLRDDFGWLLGFSIAIPLFIGIVIGAFVVGQLHSLFHIILYGSIGALFGIAIGLCLFMLIIKHHRNFIRRQEKKGGFVLWIHVDTDEKINIVMDILKKYNVLEISIE